MNIETGIIKAIQDDGRKASFGHGELARLGFLHTERAARFLSDPHLAGLAPATVRALAGAADPDSALLGLVRIAEASSQHGVRLEFDEAVGDPSSADTLIRLLGSSVALSDYLVRHPQLLPVILDDKAGKPEGYRDSLLNAVGADPSAANPIAEPGPHTRDRLRIQYFEHLYQIARLDVCAEDPPAIQPDVSRRLSLLADAALEAALAIARQSVRGHESVRLAIVALGKCGGGELNYVSDVDVLYVAEPAEADHPHSIIGVATDLAKEVARVCSERTPEGALWQVDANLRPEGKDGPLVRSLESYERYYRQWAQSWEFQALLKARASAGDRALASAFVESTRELVWQASSREGFVEDTRAMRRRVITLISRDDAHRHLKLGPGGLRDVEFTVQLLQMVHGRTDDSIRCASTLEALAQLRDGGYVGRAQARELDDAYRNLRVLEHRMQLFQMRRTHVIPTNPQHTRRLARSLGIGPDSFGSHVDSIRRRVRDLHEEIYYRPLLAVSARLSDEDITLSPQAQLQRLAAIGYRDPARAVQHIDALTKGLSRRAAIQRQLLPSMLGWFADGTDPDVGLLAFRRLSDALGSTHWYLGMLRDSGVAAQRLTRILSSSAYMGQELERFPSAVRWLARESDLRGPRVQELRSEMDAARARGSTREALVATVRDIRRRELIRIALAHLSGQREFAGIAHALSDLADAIVEQALIIAVDSVREQLGGIDLGLEIAVLALGSYGAREMGYSSDADVQFLAVDCGAGEHTIARATKVASTVQKILNAPSSGINMHVNADLRPEGRSGPLVRTFESWQRYYRSHAQHWEHQALVRARVAVASPEVRETILQEVDQHRYPREGLGPERLRELARMKARIEAERLPRGVKSTHHLKLGRGAMTDVEWVVQRLVMMHAHEHPQLRVQGTLDALRALADLGFLSTSDADALSEAWLLAWYIRRALFLWKGREVEAFPSDLVDLWALTNLVHVDAASPRDFEQTYLKVMRHSRAVAQQQIFGE